MCRKGVVKARHREVRSAERVVDSEGRTGRSGDRARFADRMYSCDSQGRASRSATSMACLVLVKKKKKKRKREKERARERERKRASPFLWCRSELSGRARTALYLGVTPSYRAGVGLSRTWQDILLHFYYENNMGIVSYRAGLGLPYILVLHRVIGQG